jgi:hypothetical protein
MSSRDTWAVGPSGSLPLPATPAPPSRPDLPASSASAWAQPLVAQSLPVRGSFATAESWKRIGAVLGVFWAFFFLLTIPGWLALGHYKKWKRGEIDTPNGLIMWGFGFSALMVLVILISLGSES